MKMSRRASERMRDRVRLATLLLEAVKTAKRAHVVLRVTVDFAPEMKGKELDEVRSILAEMLKELSS